MDNLTKVKSRHGSILTETFFVERERYHYDNTLKACDGWFQYDTDQDFRCYGIWVNPKKMEIIEFVEGEYTHYQCENLAIFSNEIKSKDEFHGPPPAVATVIHDGGHVEEIYAKRPDFVNLAKKAMKKPIEKLIEEGGA